MIGGLGKESFIYSGSHGEVILFPYLLQKVYHSLCPFPSSVASLARINPPLPKKSAIPECLLALAYPPNPFRSPGGNIDHTDIRARAKFPYTSY